MKTVKIGDLRNRLSAHLQFVRNGEEVVVCDRNEPIARILPFTRPDQSDEAAEEAFLVATGQLKLPKEEMDWKSFWALPRSAVAHDSAQEAIEWAKGDR